ncbi:MAG: hypothetical protein M3Q56_00115 [Bacteroidota bacterium]|nr:hypothetical protein [Bacteroidota bacterium]
MKKTTLVILMITVIIVAIQSCKKDKRQAKKTDKELYAELSDGVYTYYQGGNLLSAAAPSPHGSFKLRFNSTAQSVDIPSKLTTLFRCKLTT